MDTIILWVYIAMLVAGGLMGFIKAGSKASLIASVAFAIPLTLAAVGIVPAMVADICLILLLIVFGKKYAKGKKFMRKRFRELLVRVAPMQPLDMENALAEAFNDWKGDEEQVDDVLVVGVRI